MSHGVTSPMQDQRFWYQMLESLASAALRKEPAKALSRGLILHFSKTLRGGGGGRVAVPVCRLFCANARDA